MKKSIALTFALVIALSGVTAGSARANPQHKRVTRLAGEVKRLRKRLHDATAAVALTKSRLAASQAQLAALQARADGVAAQNSDLRNLLTQRTNERDTARKQAAALQTELDAIPTPLAVAEEQVTREIGWLEHANLPSTYSHGDFVALSVMNYVESHVSVTAYSYLLENHLPLPAVTPNAILAAQAGQCGHHALVFAALMRHFGYPVRSAQFYWSSTNGPQSHIADEVFYDGAWHYFDSYYGLYWTDANGHVMGITDVRADGGALHQDGVSVLNLNLDPWYAGDNDAWFETDPATSVVLGAAPLDG